MSMVKVEDDSLAPLDGLQDHMSESDPMMMEPTARSMQAGQVATERQRHIQTQDQRHCLVRQSPSVP